MAKGKFSKASDIRVGVIGYGGAFNMGRHHLNGMQAAGMTPTAVCEIDPDRLKIAQTDFPGIETYDTVSAMLKKSEVDLVTIITPHNTHADLAVQCLKAGRSVVCEKPLAITTAECDRMIAAAEKSGAVISTYHNRHWDGIVLQALKMVRDKQVVGDLVRIEAHMGGWGQPRDWWRSSKSISGGILYDWGVHLLEYCLQLIDSEIVEVSGYAKQGYWAPKVAWKEDTNEDEGFAVIRFANGVWLTLRITHIDMNPRPRILEITGTEGTYLCDHGSYELKTFKAGEQRTAIGQNCPGEGHKFYENIAAHLTKGEELVITAEWARRPIHILDLANQSVIKGQAMKARYQ